MVYGTVFYVEKLVERYFSALREVNALQQADKPNTAEAETQTTAEESTQPTSALASIDPSNTAMLATAEQHAPLLTWFAARQIEARFDYTLVDTSGFFDDAARMLGDRYELYAELIDRVRFAYRKSHTWISLELSKLSQKDAQAINTLCRQLYSHTFFAFMELLTRLHKAGRGPSVARSVKVVFPNEDLHELDVIALPDGQPPICIECKSGEFRRDIDKYLRLRKRLGIDRSRFIICAADLTEEQAAGLTKMYELTFVSLASLKPHLEALVQGPKSPTCPPAR